MAKAIGTLLGVLATFVVAAIAFSSPDRSCRWPAKCGGGGSMPLIHFAYEDTVVTANNCVQFMSVLPDANCGAGTTEVFLGDDKTITKIEVVIGSLEWETTEACDLDIRDDGAIIGSFEIGKAALDQAGENETLTLSAAVAAGSLVSAQITAPATDYCADGAGCACAGNGSFQIWVYAQ